MESTNDLRYLLNDLEQAKRLVLWEGNTFNNHWMTITKYYKNNNTGQTNVAFSTWGRRVSINSKLLQDKEKENTYYPSFYCYEIKTKGDGLN